MIELKELCIGQNEVNEDNAYACETFAFCIDGATGLTKINVMDKYSDAAWFSNFLKDNLSKHLLDNNKTIKQILKIIINEANLLIQSNLLSKGIDNYNYPSAGISICRVLPNNEVECYRLGDTLISVHFNDDHFEFLDEINLKRLDNSVLRKQKMIAISKNINMIDAREYITKDLIYNRSLMNKENGYYVLEPFGQGIDFGEYKRFNKKDIKSIVLCSDGYYAVSDTYHLVSDYKQMVREIENNKLYELYDLLDEVTKKDSTCNLYPRFKIKDDSSAVYLSFIDLDKIVK